MRRGTAILLIVTAACGAFETASSSNPGVDAGADGGADGSADGDAETIIDGGADGDATTGSVDAGAKIVFVTFGTLIPGGDAGPPPQFVVAADALCNQEGAKALGSGHTFVAWLSTTTTNAITRVPSEGPWTAGNKGALVFANRTAIYSDGPATTFNNFADGGLAPSLPVWTGTGQAGGHYGTSCGGNWTNKTLFGHTGRPYTTGAALKSSWTSSADLLCNGDYPVICFEL